MPSSFSSIAVAASESDDGDQADQVVCVSNPDLKVRKQQVLTAEGALSDFEKNALAKALSHHKSRNTVMRSRETAKFVFCHCAEAPSKKNERQQK